MNRALPLDTKFNCLPSCLQTDRPTEPSLFVIIALYDQVLGMEGASQGATRDWARSNLAVLKQEAGDFEGAVEGYREVLM